ncbi:MAG: hypothetical protein JWM36_225 [Hyphomicrobiales bacterium]|nr:hypothetical protein [Hyphomicrobiales bacterium]
MRNRLLGGCALVASVVSAGSCAGSEQPWSLSIVKPGRPGVLDTCAILKTTLLASSFAANETPLRLTQGLTIRWQGGDLVQAPISRSQDTWNTLDACFVLTVGDKVVAAGAVVPAASARLLRFDTLVLRKKDPLEFDLVPAFPAQIQQPVPPLWTAALTPISRVRATP